MKVKKFVASNMPEAMKKIRADLGTEAVILNSKRIATRGFLGLFKKEKIEVIAAIDEDKGQKHERIMTENERSLTAESSVKQSTTSDQLKEEVDALKNVVSSLQRNVPSFSQGDYPNEIQKITTLLREQEITQQITEQVAENLIPLWYRSENPSETLMFEQAYKFLLGKLEKAFFGPVYPSTKIIQLVGPTGVGKTTTVAKIASYYHLEKKLDVGFITTDTYRIAAVDQLKTYAKILNIPVEVAYTPADFQRAREKFRHKDLILVDSAGRNFQKKLYVEDLKTMVDFDENMTTYLVLSLTAKYQDMKKVVDQFIGVPIDRFVFTKIDETTSYGAMINLVTETNIGIAYVTTGQNVPDDIEKADAKGILNRLFEEGYHE